MLRNFRCYLTADASKKKERWQWEILQTTYPVWQDENLGQSEKGQKKRILWQQYDVKIVGVYACKIIQDKTLQENFS